MKKFTAILLTVIMVASLFTSCSNSIAPNIDETVSVSFDESTSRSLTASLVPFDKDDYFWTYAARKTDDTGLISGQTPGYNADGTGSVPVKTSGEGLTSVPGFSQGSWKFMLFAYADQDYTRLVYSGENLNVVLKKGDGTENKVKVQVSPVQSGAGTLEIANTLSLRPQTSNEDFDSASFTKFITIKTMSDPETVKYTGTNTEHTLDAGSYLVQVDFVKNDITYASGSVVATVFSNMTTTVGGYLDELITHAAFDSEINPDVMNKSVYSSSVDKANVPDTGVTIKKTDTSASAQDDSKVTATVTKDAASDAITSAITYAAGNGVSNATETNTSVAFELKVNTTNATSTSLEYEIGMNALITVTEGNNTKQLTQDISRFTQYVTVTIDIQKGLSNVVVTHYSNEMLKLNSKDQSFTDESAPDGAYFYDSTAGKLYIKTKTFSPFSIKYDEVKYVARIGEANYSSLQDAVNAAEEGATVKIIKDVVLTKTVTVNKGITLDLNGYSITGNNVRALSFIKGTSSITGTGVVQVVETSENTVNPGSSVIRVGDGTSKNKKVPQDNVALTIDENVTVSTTVCYGVTVFGSDTNESVVINGTINSYSGAVSGNGSEHYWGTNITINENAILTATGGPGIYHPQAGTLTINGGTIIGRTGVEVKGGTVTINDGYFDSNYTEEPVIDNAPNKDGGNSLGYALSVVEKKGYVGNANVTVSGGTYYSSVVNGKSENSPNTGKENTLTITGGTFSSNPSEYVASGYEAIESEGQWIVSRKVLAKIGDNSYYTLEDAIEAAVDGDTITLTSDISKTVSSEKGSCYTINDKSITIDGQNHVLTLTGLFEGESASGTEAYGIKISGKDSAKSVTLQNMKINAINIQRAVRTDENIRVTIDHCTISTNGCGIHVKGGNKVDIKNNSTLTVNVVDNLKFSAHLRTAVMVGAENAKVTVDGCQIYAVNKDKTSDKNTMCKGLYVGSHSKDAKITAKNTSVTADYSIAIDGAQYDYTQFEGKPTQIEIESGNYSGLFGSPSGLSYKSLTINGGTFSDITNLNSFNGKDNDVAKLVISGGTFPFEPDNKYISEGYKAIDQGNGTWTVEPSSN